MSLVWPTRRRLITTLSWRVSDDICVCWPITGCTLYNLFDVHWLQRFCHSRVHNWLTQVNRSLTGNFILVIGSSKLYCVQPVIGHHTKISSLSRYDRVVINRLRVGHTRLTNSYLLKGENQPECQACQSVSFPTCINHLTVFTHLCTVADFCRCS